MYELPPMPVKKKPRPPYRKPEAKEEEVYLTPQEFADALKVSLVTLWHWDGKGITRPLKIGNKKRYRKSDLEKILTQ